jgi:hypothetical protein
MQVTGTWIHSEKHLEGSHKRSISEGGRSARVYLVKQDRVGRSRKERERETLGERRLKMVVLVWGSLYFLS